MLEMKKVVWIDDVGDRWENLEDWRKLHVCPGQGCLSCPLSKKNNGMNVLCDRLVRDFPERVLTLMQGELCRVEVEEKEKKGEKMEKMKDEEEVVWIENMKSGERKKVERGYVPMILLCGDSVCSGCPVWRKTEQAGLGCCIDWMKEHWEEGLGLLGWKKVEEDEDMGEQEEVEQKEVKQEGSEWGESEQGNSEYDYFLMRHLGVGYRERFHVEGTEGVYHVGVAGRLFRVYDRDGSRKRKIEDGQVLYTLLEHPERVRKGLTVEHREYLEAVVKIFPEVQWVKRDGGWLLFGDDKLMLLSRENRDWEELKDGEERDVRELLGE